MNVEIKQFETSAFLAVGVEREGAYTKIRNIRHTTKVHGVIFDANAPKIQPHADTSILELPTIKYENNSITT